MKKKVDESNEKRKEKIIKIINTVIFIAIFIMIVLILIRFYNSRKPGEKIKFESYYARYFFDNDDKGFLDDDYFGNHLFGGKNQPSTRYKLINTYDEYIKIINSLDLVREDTMNAVLFDSEGVNKRFEEIKNNFEKREYDEEYFKQYSLLLVEYKVSGQVLHDIKLDNICKVDDNICVYVSEYSSGCVGGKTGTLFFIKIPKTDIENVNNVKVYMNHYEKRF